MKVLGHVFTASDVAELDHDNSGDVDFPELLTLLARKMADEDT